ncbi:MAG: hypothetical protein GX589_02175, partial [Deltaproteobacteria bacterium]|nr:hypothetical protein [Deltaproteobacteria bacterium]
EARADVCQEVGQPTATKAAADVSPSLDDGETEARGRNLLIAYDLQLQVLDRLRQDPRLSSATVPEMVEFVRTITNAVCASFDAGKFIKH